MTKVRQFFLRLDRNGDGRADVIIFDLKRSGRWDLSFWDENFTGNWTLVGYHDDGSLKPTRFESYAEFQSGWQVAEIEMASVLPGVPKQTKR